MGMRLRALIPWTTILITLSIGGFLYLGLSSEESFQRMRRLEAIQAGLKTCQSRVDQTFISLAMGLKNAQALGSDFYASTGECFKQLEAMSKGHISVNALSSLRSDITWFHKRVKRMLQNNAKFSASSEATISYERIFDSGQRFVNEVETLQVSEKDYRFYQIAGATFLLIFLFMLLIRAIMSPKAHQVATKKLNEEAVRLRFVKAQREQVVQYLKDLTLKLGISEAYELINTISWKDVQSIEQAPKVEIDEPRATIAEERTEEVVKQVEREPLTASLSSLIDQSLTLMSDKIMALGIEVDLKVRDDLLIDQSVEEHLEFIYNSFAYGVEKLRESDNRRLWAKAYGEDKVFTLKIGVAGVNFKESEVSLINNNSDGEAKSVNLLILREVSKELGIRLNISNRNDQGHLSSVLEIVIPQRDQTARKTLKGLKVGKKKDILKSLEV